MPSTPTTSTRKTRGPEGLAWDGPTSDVPTSEAFRRFSSGATRDTDANKPDYEGFLSPLVLARYAEYMHASRRLADGTIRKSDNWQQGIPRAAYVKSLWRHFMDVWSLHRGFPSRDGADLEDSLCAVLFNASGLLHEVLLGRDTGQEATSD